MCINENSCSTLLAPRYRPVNAQYCSVIPCSQALYIIGIEWTIPYVANVVNLIFH